MTTNNEIDPNFPRVGDFFAYDVRCPTCRMGWGAFPPCKIDGTDAYRCVECKAVYTGPMINALVAAPALPTERVLTELLRSKMCGPHQECDDVHPCICRDGARAVLALLQAPSDPLTSPMPKINTADAPFHAPEDGK